MTPLPARPTCAHDVARRHRGPRATGGSRATRGHRITLGRRITRGRRVTRGFTLIAVLVTVSLMASLVAVYSRHVVVEQRSNMSSPALLGSREACHSGLQCARQALVSGVDVFGDVPSAGGSAHISVSSLIGGTQSIEVSAVDADGFGARRVAELALRPQAASQPSGPSSLPTLDPLTVDTLIASGALDLHHYSTSQRLSGVELSGLMIVHNGVDLELDDVVLHGAIVSADVISKADLGDFNALAAPRVLVDGNLRIDAHDEFPGVAILLPDGIVASGDSEARVQIHGDVIAHDLALLQAGALGGNVSAVNLQLADPDLLDRLGEDRKAPDWSGELALGATAEPATLAVIPPATALQDLLPIVTYWDGP